MVAKQNRTRIDPRDLAFVVLMTTYEMEQKRATIDARVAFLTWLENQRQMAISDPRTVSFFCEAISLLRRSNLIQRILFSSDPIVLTPKGRALAQEALRKLGKDREDAESN
ncbi:MAG: hypothetical protein ACK5XN_21850 [Bacteroidota bacterium]